MIPTEIPRSIRQILVAELESWQKEGLISAALVETLRKRYDFDFEPPAAPAVHPPQEAVQFPLPPPPQKPRLTLAQTLLSESSIKIALYLGAFFVIAAALILAALVASLRLPVLVIVTALFLGGALFLKRRLPQPSFILYVIFAALLPITAWVLADVLNLVGKPLTGFWVIALFCMTLLLAFSTWFYSSTRFFSSVTLLSLDAALIMTGLLIEHPSEVFIPFLLTLASLAGLGGAYWIQRWQNTKISLPIFILAQVQQIVILFWLFGSMIVGNERGWIDASSWALIAIFAFLSNILFPFKMYPWIASTALIPVAWLALARPGNGQNVTAIIFNVWGMVMAVAGSVLHFTRQQLRIYTLPLSVVAILPLFLGAGLGLVHDLWLGFGLFLGSGILLSILHIIRRQAWMWMFALGSGLVAYFTFFQLPFMEQVSTQICPQIAGAILFLLLADILIPSGKPAPEWRWPLRGWAILTGLAALISSLPIIFFGGPIESAGTLIALGSLSILYLAYATRLRKPLLAILFSVHATLAVTLTLVYFEFRDWLPIQVGLAIVYYLCGFLLLRRGLQKWSHIFRWSGLALTAVLTLAAFSYTGAGWTFGLHHDTSRGWFVAILGTLFLIEVFLKAPWLESVAPAVYSVALGMILDSEGVMPPAYYAFGIAFLFLGLDLLYTRLRHRRGIKWLTRALGGCATGAAPILAFAVFYPVSGAIFCITLSMFFVLQALVYRQARLGYLATSLFTLAVLFTDLKLFEHHWIWAMSITSVLFYGLSLLFKRLKQPDWGNVLLYSGLALGSLTALSSPFERSGVISSLPVAIAASLWAVDSSRRRIIWLAFPATALYIMAYFILLSTLEVAQPQFYSIGAAALGILMHYLLIRSGSRTGAFITGMVSQLALIGTSYIQFISTEELIYFIIMFLQSLVILGYGIVVRSRSLVITPIVLVIVGVVTVVFGALRGMSTVILVGCTGIGLILLSIAALLLRERITTLRDQLKDWNA